VRIEVWFSVDGPTKRNHKSFSKGFDVDWLCLPRPGDEIQLDVNHPMPDAFVVESLGWYIFDQPAVRIMLEPETVSKERISRIPGSAVSRRTWTT